MHSSHAGCPDSFRSVGACGGRLRKYQRIGSVTGYCSSHDSGAYDHCCDYDDDYPADHDYHHHDYPADHDHDNDYHHDGSARSNCGRVRG